MQTPFHRPAEACETPTRTNVLRVFPERPVAWVPAGSAGRVIVPKADEEAWEGTEIDVRRTVL